MEDAAEKSAGTTNSLKGLQKGNPNDVIMHIGYPSRDRVCALAPLSSMGILDLALKHGSDFREGLREYDAHRKHYSVLTGEENGSQ